ncbi:MAG: hypothetical protein J2P48_02480 [Alphaproteobacteria bacterium]|nr:hypothetical protein [Alphaproteobacteria bacterium]
MQPHNRWARVQDLARALAGRPAQRAAAPGAHVALGIRSRGAAPAHRYDRSVLSVVLARGGASASLAAEMIDVRQWCAILLLPREPFVRDWFRGARRVKPQARWKCGSAFIDMAAATHPEGHRSYFTSRR